MPTRQSLAYSDSGGSDKPAILLLHGFLGCKEDWEEIAVSLQTDFRVIGLDLPGHGESLDLDGSSYSVSGVAHLVLQTLDYLKVPRCHLVGYSMGARIALYLAVHFPERFARVVIESGSAGLATEAEREARRSQDAKLAQKLRSIPLSKFLAEWYDQPLFHTIKRDQARFEDLLGRRLKGHAAELALALGGLGTGSQPFLGSELAGLPHEILFAAGALDQKYTELAKGLGRLCAHGTAWVVPGAGHALHFEQPVAYIDRLKLFLTEGK